MEEGGSNVLFLAMGFLAWMDARTVREAPLVLVPVSLSRSGPGPRYSLKILDDEPRFNLTLIEKLGKEHSIRTLDGLASELRSDGDPLDVNGIMKLVAEAVGTFPEWRVLPRVVLGMFRFSKHLMLKDLASIKESGRLDSNPILNLIINKVPLPGPAGVPLEPHELDDGLPPSDELLPLRADSSQLAAVARATSGESFVLIGPPGTGKSQTIANIIAQSIALGKSVLFVAEKAAALNVVHRRLMSIGLASLCLELHSNRSDRKEVMRQLNRAMEEQAGSPLEKWRDMSGRLASVRGKLNSYARAVHLDRPSGYSVFKAVGSYLPRKGTHHVKIGGASEWESVLGLEAEELGDMLDTAGNLGALRSVVRDRDGLMRFLRTTEWKPLWQKGVVASAKGLGEAWLRLEAFEGCLGPLEDPGLSGTPLCRAGIMLRLAEFLPLARKGDLGFVFEGPGNHEAVNLERALELLKEASAILGAVPDAAGGGLGRYGVIMDELDGLSGTLKPRVGFDPERLKRDSTEWVLGEAERRRGRFVAAWGVIGSGEADAILAEIGLALKAIEEYRKALRSLSVKYDEARAMSLDLRRLSEIWDSAENAVWPWSWLRRRRVVGAMGRASRSGRPLDPRGDLQALMAAHKSASRLKGLAKLNRLYMGQDAPYRGRDTDPEALEGFRDIVMRLQSERPAFRRDVEAISNAALSAGSLLDSARELAAVLKDWGSWGHWGERVYEAARETFGGFPDAPADGELWAETVRRAGDDIDAFRGMLTGLLGGLGWEGDLDRLSFGEADRAGKDVLANQDQLQNCVEYLKLKAKAEEAGLGGLTEALEKELVRGDEAKDAVQLAFADSFLFQAMEADPAARGSSPTQRDHDLELFLANYTGKLGIAVGQIKGQVRPKGWLDDIPYSEHVIFKKEKVRKKGFLPVRKLLAAVPNLVRKATPCLLMSPMSVAQYLPLDGPPFDLVIFDEASQIQSSDAVGALARARRAVVVGDPKQLPPTDYFTKKLNEETEDESESGDDQPLESILSDCQAAGMREVVLRWHYRSRSESLIAFSNEKYYEGRLVTFPSPAASDKAVSFRLIKEGIYDRGNSRTNRIEAEAVVKDIVRLLKSPEADREGFSVGVVTFSEVQKEMIENILDGYRDADPALDRFFDEKADEPLIVKNLENIQGDEREHIFFSVGYGPDAHGPVSLNFGPLNKDGGERRLNVAITRARRSVRVFASFPPEELEGRKSLKDGVRDLKDFMLYARASERAAEKDQGDGVPVSEFAGFVGDWLEKKNWKVRRGLGRSDFKLDLGVVDPDDGDRFLAGVECDGESFRMAATAVDREILRGEVLANLGWKIFRLWCVDWWKPTGGTAADRLLGDLDKALGELVKERQAYVARQRG
jgi:hypothetical protein